MNSGQMILTAIVFFICGFVVATFMYRTFIEEVGTVQIDVSARPFIFRLVLDKDLDVIKNRRMVYFKVDHTWHADRERYIHEVTEKEINEL